MKNNLHETKHDLLQFSAIDQATFENFVKGKIIKKTHQFTEKALYLYCDQYSETAGQKAATMFFEASDIPYCQTRGRSYHTE